MTQVEGVVRWRQAAAYLTKSPAVTALEPRSLLADDDEGHVNHAEERKASDRVGR